jgi:3-dehydroquinate synthase
MPLSVLHGEAVATGMVLAARVSNMLKLLSPADTDLIEELVTAAGLPAQMKIDPDTIYQNIRKDKKKSGERIRFVLLEGLGNAVVREIPLNELNRMLYDLC